MSKPPTDVTLARELFRRRLQAGAVFAVSLLVLLLLRFSWIQLVQHDHYKALSESNRLALVPVVPPRGVVYDRNGAVLAASDWGMVLEMTPDEVDDPDATLAALASLVNLDEDDLKRFRRMRADSKPFEPIPVRMRLTESEAARFAVNRYRFPGVEMRVRQWRNYPFGALLSHVLGYIGRINKADRERLESDKRWVNYRGDQYIGKAGVEKYYEEWLHGVTGFDRVEVDSAGRAVRVLDHVIPSPGNPLTLHLDAGLQQVAEQAFGHYRGALVALDPANGGVLALVSKPGFDPNLFIEGIDRDNWRALNESIDRPLLNRALRGIYPPGSTLKPFMALAGLELGFRKPGDTISDPGYYSLPGSSHRYRDWKKDGHGIVDLKKSIVISCDTYYYRLAQQMGIEKMRDFLAHFGFGKPTQVDLDGEMSGLLPSPEWKMRRFRQPWWAGETVIAGIGQGYMLATPMQLAVATMAIANDGIVYKPQLVRSWRDLKTGTEIAATPEILGRIDFAPENLAVVKEGMHEVTLPGGTAAGAGAGAPYAFAGKTGTAQVVGMASSGRSLSSSARHRDNALFIAFAPLEKPAIVVAVMVENGGHGGSTAAPIARKVFDYWVTGRAAPGAASMPEDKPDGDDDEQEDRTGPVTGGQVRAN